MYVELYKHYDKGYLLEAGGLNDQPSWYIDAMAVVGSEMKQLEADMIKEAKSDDA